MDFKYPYTDFHELNLDWFLARFKELVEEWTRISEDNAAFKLEISGKMDTLEHTVQTFTQFVTNYFDNLDVQDEINTKLDAMVADGTISALLQPIFNSYAAGITNRMNVLEARMDEFSSLTEGSTTGDAELADIRVAYNGMIYPTAGDAVRGQVDEVLDEIHTNLGDVQTVDSTTTIAAEANGGAQGDIGQIPTITSSTSYHHVQIDAVPGAAYHIRVNQSTSGNYPYYVHALDAGGIIIGRYAPSAGVTTSGRYDYDFIIPFAAKYLLITSYYYQGFDLTVKVIYDIQSQIDDINGYLNLPNDSEAKSIADSIMEDKRPDIFALNRDNICLNFVFTTDTHANDHRADNDLDLFVRVANEKFCDFACHGGDLITVTSSTTQTDYYKDIGPVLDKLGKINIPLYCPEGNHDVNGKNDDAAVVTPAQWYAMTKTMANVDNMQIDNTYSGYFYKDFDDVKIRVIVLDNYHGHDPDSGIEHSGIYGAEAKWFAESMLLNKQDFIEWSILILIHDITDNLNTPVWRAITAYKNGALLNESGYEVDYRVQGPGSIVGVIHGHEHSDTYTTLNDVNIIGVTCGYTADTNPVSINDFAIDIFTINPTSKKINATRLGRGSDREYSYT